MAALNTGKIAEVLLEQSVEGYEHQDKMLDLVSFNEPDGAMLQNAGNVLWTPKQQHAPIIEGFDVTGKETGIIEETYPQILGTPKNDFVKQRADDMRDQRYWERRGKQSGLRQATEQNKLIANAIALQGSLFVRSNVTNGYSFLSEGQVRQNERQLVDNGRCFILNDRDTKLFGDDLAARQTMQGRPESVWATGQLGQNIAGYNAYTGSFLPNLVGGADPATTVTGNQSFKPEAGSVVAATGVVTNIDCRIASIAVAASASYNIGDKVTFSNTGTPVNALGLADKTDTGQSMTFSVVAKPDATTISVFPKPIAADDATLSTLEKAYANIDTTILNGATVDRLNIDATNKTNLFFDKDAIQVMGGNIPAELFAQYDGMKVITHTMKNGQVMYMIYDGDIASLTFRFRLFVWYGITVADPSNCGVAVTF